MRSPLNSCQERALSVLQSGDNVFVTGAAGSGKSYLIREFLRDKDDKRFPMLASTGAAAILVGGRTFHSYFGLGIMEGGISATIERASRNKRLIKRLNAAEGVVIDEVSMLSGATLRAAEAIARNARASNRPWGGLKVIAVGDFAQLPPVNPYSRAKDWAFADEVWAMSDFKPAVLREVMRTSEPRFLEVLNDIREGRVTGRVREFLSERTSPVPESFDGARMFARRNEVEEYNLRQLAKIQSPSQSFTTIYEGKEAEIEKFKKNAPIPEVITLKEGALVMLRQNDVEGDWVNGSLGYVRHISPGMLSIALLDGKAVAVERSEFTLLDADGKPVVVARNFPVTLAWAVTIHKAQGATLDRMHVDLRRLWEPGQAYVALSRAKHPDGLFIEGWQPSSIFADPVVTRFHQQLADIVSFWD